VVLAIDVVEKVRERAWAAGQNVVAFRAWRTSGRLPIWREVTCESLAHVCQGTKLLMVLSVHHLQEPPLQPHTSTYSILGDRSIRFTMFQLSEESKVGTQFNVLFTANVHQERIARIIDVSRVAIH